MIDKLNDSFVKCVETWIRIGSFESGRSYHYFWGDGYVIDKIYRVSFKKQLFKPKVKLQRLHEGCYYNIPLTNEEEISLWECQKSIKKHMDIRNEKNNTEYEELIERLNKGM